jgi:hypothetical protein
MLRAGSAIDSRTFPNPELGRLFNNGIDIATPVIPYTESTGTVGLALIVTLRPQ